MADIILITGGSRSGKSSYAQARAEKIDGKKVFVATCPRIDNEIDDRIAKHIAERKGKGWQTVEEEIAISEVVKSHKNARVILLDCLTLWINNLLYVRKLENLSANEDDMRHLCNKLLQESRNHPGTIFFVTNEVGSGIVPESKETRLYRDLVGKCNQVMGQGADEVILVSCGIPLALK